MFSKSQLDRLNKGELIEKFLQLQSDFSESMKTCCDNVAKLTEKVEALESSLVVSQRVNSLLSSKVNSLERQLHQLEQYSRRECLEVVGIPASVQDDKLQDTVCDILKKIKVDCYEADIEACHRIKNNRTIVKFSSRKYIFEIFKTKKKLKDTKFGDIEGMTENTKIFINESLCPYYRLLWSKCKDLFSKNVIYRFWTTNGTVRVKKSESSPVKVILHEDDLEEFRE